MGKSIPQAAEVSQARVIDCTILELLKRRTEPFSANDLFSERSRIKLSRIRDHLRALRAHGYIVEVPAESPKKYRIRNRDLNERQSRLKRDS